VRRWPRDALPVILQRSMAGAEDASASPSEASPLAGMPAHITPSQSPSVRWQVQNTFIHAAPQPPTPLPGARRRAHSVPREVGASSSAEASPVADLRPPSFGRPFHPVGGSGCISRDSTADSTGSASGSAIGLAPPLSPASSSGTPEPNPTPLSTPVKVPLSRLESMGGVSEEGGLRTPQRRSLFGGMDEPLSLDDVIVERTPGRCRPAVSPCARSAPKAGGAWMVQNTFIHASLPPFTPAPGAARARARSLPRDYGSEFKPPCVLAAAAGTGAPPTPAALKRHRTADSFMMEPASPGINDSPLFVPPSPGLATMMPPTPQTPLYAGCHYAVQKVRSAAAADSGRVLRLSDYL